jgi:ribonuclease BN (tRNA processing enzyme)
MKIEVLGGHGGLAKGFETTSFLIDDKLLIDAGAVASTLSIDRQKQIENILISHCHLDHIKDLAFICDNCFGLRPQPFHVYTHATVNQIIKEHLLNDKVWPDFTKLPNAKNPTMTIHSIPEEVLLVLGDYKITPVKVKHAHDAMGFIIEKGDSAVVFTLDTSETDRIWEVAKTNPKVKAIFTEVSFPNTMSKVAEISEHHTAESIFKELSKMPKAVPIILTHIKPNYRGVIEQEVRALNEPRFHVLKNDGEIFNF